MKWSMRCHGRRRLKHELARRGTQPLEMGLTHEQRRHSQFLRMHLPTPQFLQPHSPRQHTPRLHALSLHIQAARAWRLHAAYLRTSWLYMSELHVHG